MADGLGDRLYGPLKEILEKKEWHVLQTIDDYVLYTKTHGEANGMTKENLERFLANEKGYRERLEGALKKCIEEVLTIDII